MNMAPEFDFSTIDINAPWVDAATSAFIEGELTAYYGEIMEQQYPTDLMAMGQILPYKQFVGYEGVEDIVITSATTVGMAEVIAPGVSGGPPVDEITTKARFNVETQSNTAFVTFHDIVAAKQANRPLDITGMKKLKRAEERYHGVKGWYGDPDFNLFGLHTITVPEYEMPINLYTSTDANVMVNAFIDSFNDMIKGAGITIGTPTINDSSRLPLKLAMSSTLLTKLDSTYLNGTSTSVLMEVKRIAKQLLNGRELQIASCEDVKNVKLPNYPVNKELMYFLPEDEDKICLGDFLTFRVYPPQLEGLNYKVVSVFRSALVICADPFSVLRVIVR
jgi:hypothetical protein